MNNNIKEITGFEHNMAAHCENGVTSNLIKFQGVTLSEAMIFGIGSGLFFSYMFFYKINGVPVSSFRPWPGIIFKRTARRLGFEITAKKFRNKEESMQALDSLLEKGIPVGMVVGVYNLSYFPPAYRFHFNAHNIVVVGKQNDEYLVSDPVMPEIEKISYKQLQKVRYAKGTFKPSGRMYYISKRKYDTDIKSAIIKGIKQTCSDMLTIPVPIFGVKGIRHLANRVKNWEQRLGARKASLYMAQIVRMQEEIGTGGAGFRFLYAAFLQEASEIFKSEELLKLSEQMTKAGDKWREFATLAGRISKKRSEELNPYQKASEILVQIADIEYQIFKDLQKLIKFLK